MKKSLAKKGLESLPNTKERSLSPLDLELRRIREERIKKGVNDPTEEEFVEILRGLSK